MFFSLLSSLLLASFALAAPANTGKPLQFPPADPNALLCKLPFISKFLCPRSAIGASHNVKTKLGSAQGSLDTSGAVRFSVKYASANRWAASQVATAWELP